MNQESQESQETIKLGKLNAKKEKLSSNIGNLNNVSLFMDRVTVTGKEEVKVYVESLNWVDAELKLSKVTLEELDKELLKYKI